MMDVAIREAEGGTTVGRKAIFSYDRNVLYLSYLSNTQDAILDGGGERRLYPLLLFIENLRYTFARGGVGQW